VRAQGDLGGADSAALQLLALLQGVTGLSCGSDADRYVPHVQAADASLQPALVCSCMPRLRRRLKRRALLIQLQCYALVLKRS